MKFKMLLNIVRIKKFYRINLKLKIKLSEAIILFIVLYNSRESERKRNRERERGMQPRNFQSSEGDGNGARNYTKAPEVLGNSLAR